MVVQVRRFRSRDARTETPPVHTGAYANRTAAPLSSSRNQSYEAGTSTYSSPPSAHPCQGRRHHGHPRRVRQAELADQCIAKPAGYDDPRIKVVGFPRDDFVVPIFLSIPFQMDLWATLVLSLQVLNVQNISSLLVV